MSLTPHDWAPVAFGLAQISVPRDWHVYYEPQCFAGGRKPGWVQVGWANTETWMKCTDSRGNPGVPHVVIEPVAALGPMPTGDDVSHLIVNGFRISYVKPTVHALPPGCSSCQGMAKGMTEFFVPKLGVGITVRGINAARLLRTLTWSPRAVVLAKRPLSPAPRSWKTVTAKVGTVRLSFTVPPSWSVQRSEYPYGECQNDPTWALRYVSGAVVISSDADRTPLFCPEMPYTDSPVAPSNWLWVDEHLTPQMIRNLGLVFPATGSKSCFLIDTVRLCPATHPTGSILFVETRVSWAIGGAAPSTGHVRVVFSLGLGGRGEVAREVLDSVRELTVPSTVG